MSHKIGNLTVWINPFKKGDKEPDYRGKADIDGVQVDIALWINRSVADVPIHMSGSFHDPSEAEGPLREPEPPPEYQGKNPPRR